MTVKVMIPARIQEKFQVEILAMYSSGELSAGRAATSGLRLHSC